MKKYLTLLAVASLFTACEKRDETPIVPSETYNESTETTIVNPPATPGMSTETETTETTLPAATPAGSMDTTTETTLPGSTSSGSMGTTTEETTIESTGTAPAE